MKKEVQLRYMYQPFFGGSSVAHWPKSRQNLPQEDPGPLGLFLLVFRNLEVSEQSKPEIIVSIVLSVLAAFLSQYLLGLQEGRGLLLK